VLNAFDGTTISGGGGAVNGYENIIFSDGSELWWKYTGTYKLTGITENASHITGGGSLIVTGGKGRYAGVKGDGTYQGTQDRTGAFNQGETLGVNDFVVNIKK
jgi:hypothetical protein